MNIDTIKQFKIYHEQRLHISILFFIYNIHLLSLFHSFVTLHKHNTQFKPPTRNI